MRRSAPILASLAFVACGPAVSEQLEGTSTTGAASGELSNSSTGAPVSTSTTAEPPGSSTTTTVETADSGSSTTGCIDEGPTVAPDPEDPDSRCLYTDLEDDCGCGHKCTVYVTGEDESEFFWSKSGCFPIDPEPVGLGEPCVHEDFAWSGRDNCPAGAMCWDLDGDGAGVCREYCSEDLQGVCAEFDAVPWVGCQECGCVCQVSCNPLLDDCAAGEVCALSYALGLCVTANPDAVGGPGDPCDTFYDCAAGNTCVEANALPGCAGDEASGCCTPYCDVDDASCPEGTACLGLWDTGQAATPILEDLGYCVDPSMIE